MRMPSRNHSRTCAPNSESERARCVELVSAIHQTKPWADTKQPRNIDTPSCRRAGRAPKAVRTCLPTRSRCNPDKSNATPTVARNRDSNDWGRGPSPPSNIADQASSATTNAPMSAHTDAAP